MIDRKCEIHKDCVGGCGCSAMVEDDRRKNVKEIAGIYTKSS